MNTQRLVKFGVMVIAWSVCRPGLLHALPISLGSAGPGNWAVLEIGTGTISMSNPAGLVDGNVGVYAGGRLSSSGPDVNGDLYLGTGSTTAFSGSANVTGATFQNAGSQALLNQARADALAAAAAARMLTGLSIANITANQTLASGVYYLAGIDLNGETLTLDGGVADSFVFNISDIFKLNNSDIILTGGLLPENVLFNFFGTQNVAFSGGGNASELHGILLSLGRNVNLSPGLVFGEIISDRNISIVSGAQAQGLNVPDSSSTLLLSCIAFGSLILFGARKTAAA